jgi:hypothetical protein
MDQGQLYDIIHQGEGVSVEFKAQFPKNASDLGREIVAFTNTRGGILLIGVDDNGNLLGVTQHPDEILQRLAGIVRDVCRPPLNPEMGCLRVGDKRVVWMNITKETFPRSSDDKYYIRVGTTVRVASSDELHTMFIGDQHNTDILRKIDAIFKNFRPENLLPAPPAKNDGEVDVEGERKRISIYEKNRGIFLIHAWQPSRKANQVADIAIMLYQHGDGPLSHKTVESVEYYLGPKFSNRPYIKTNVKSNFRLDISAYGPMLCLAKVNFKDGSQPVYLERYCDF